VISLGTYRKSEGRRDERRESGSDRPVRCLRDRHQRHLIQDEARPADIVATLLSALPAGSYLVASHGTTEHDPVGPAAGQAAYRASGVTGRARNSDEFARLAFSGLNLVPPGVVLVSEWRPDGPEPRPSPAEVSVYGGVACKQ
jgi:hypothetical protein